jgi:hypothetical protein
MKSEVFTGSSYGFDTPTLERLLQETFPPHMCMDCMTEPKVTCLVYIRALLERDQVLECPVCPPVSPVESPHQILRKLSLYHHTLHA